MFLGLDIGSSSSKAVILRADGLIAAKAVVNTGTGTLGPDKVVEKALLDAGLAASEIAYSVVTGYGRINYSLANKQITEISCHAKGVAYLNPSAKTVIDIGGQDAKVIRLVNNGKIDNFVMNDKCAAGTGRFLEVMARILDCSIDELSGLAERSTEAITISNTCTVFAESEVISRLAAGAKREDVARGAHVAVAKRVAGLANRIGVKSEVVMSGGVALNLSVVAALEKEIGDKVFIVENPQVVGALGAALFAKELYAEFGRTA